MRKLLWLCVAMSLIAGGPSAFAQTCPSAPQIITPTNSATGVPTFVNLRWTDVGATTYDVFLAPSASGGCGGNPIGTATTNTFNPQQLAANTRYEWKVRAIKNACPTVESTCASFTTAAANCPSGTPTINSPAANAQFPAGAVTFSWTGVAGATAYELWFSINNANPFLAGTTTNTSETKSLSTAGTYTWWIVTRFGTDCPTSETGRSTFTITTSCPNGTATLNSPTGLAQFTQGTPVPLQWNAVTGAVTYDVLLSLNGGPVSTALTVTTNSATLTGLNQGTYAWAIRTNFGSACPPTTSGGAAFRVVAPVCDNIAPTLKSPSADATVDAGPVTFEWNAIANAAGYRLFTLGANATSSLLAFSGTETKATITLGAGKLTWWIEAVFGSCANTVSERRGLTVREPSNCPTGTVTLVSPANGATNILSPVTFKWNAVANAKSYVVLGALNAGSTDVIGTTTSTTLTAVIPAGTIKWLVIAKADNCPDLRSTTFEFTVVRPPCPDASITLRTPASGATVSSPVHFEWTAVSNTTAYRLYVAVGGSPMEIVARTTSPDATVNLPAGAAVWKVEALRDLCEPVLSPEGRFTVATATNCANNVAPALVSPIGSQASPVQVTSPVMMKWNPVANAIAYRVWLSRNGQPASDIALTKNTEVSRLLEEEGIYYWFVEALFEGCPSMRSTLGYFQITIDRCGNNAAPTVLAPLNGATTSSPVTFSWTAVANAKGYRVIASLNGGQNFVLGETTDTTLTRVIPPGTIVFAVEAVFDQCPSTFSARTTFTIPEGQNCPTTAPALLAPANGATNVAVPVDLMWTAVPNAVRYVVMAQFNGGAPTPVGETTNTTLTLRNLPAGRFEWWVLAFVANCRPLETGHFTFATSDPTNCDNRRPVIFEPGNGSLLLATQVEFEWSRVPNAKSYKLWVAKGDDPPSVIITTTGDEVRVDVPVGIIRWSVEAVFDNCPSTYSAPAFFIATAEPPPCRTPSTPDTNIVGQALSGTEYNLRWTPLPNVDLYEVQESTTPDFSTASTQTIDGLSAIFSHVVDAPTTYLYRVRGISNCSDERGAYSDVMTTIVVPQRTSGNSRNASAEIGTLGTIVQTYFVPGAGPGASFIATVDKPWLSVVPSQGALPVAGITLNVVGDPKSLNFGTNTATVKVVVTTPTSDGIKSDGSTTSSLPFSISLVTPVTQTGKSSPPPDSLIIPAVAHAVGANDSQFESDIRLTNLGATTAKYQVNFTPSGVDGTTTGTSSTIEVAPNETTALDDVLNSMFGTGTTSTLGMLEIRPLSSSTSSTSFVTSSSGVAPVSTVASSRTYNVTPNGTFGQYIPAIPFSQFVGKGTILSLQQIAESSAYRTNFGFAEASGQAAQLTMRVYDTQNTLLATIPVSLKASEHKQINSMLAANGITSLNDGRVEVEVTSSTGKVTAYASTVDNVTSDPLLVSATAVSSVSANRYIVPGVALLNTGIANWRTDLRLFNGASSAITATMTFYPQGNPGAPVAKTLTLNPGQIAVLDNVLQTFFEQANPNPGGQVVVSTASNSSIIATARTYNQTSAGTYGQFVPGVTPAQAVGKNERALQILQLENSTRIRTNVGLAETTGKSVRVEVSLVLPDSKTTPVITYDLAPNEFRQLSLNDFGLGNAMYNVRATVRVVDGDGRVTAYGSAIDQLTQDPTYVLAQ